MEFRIMLFCGLFNIGGNRNPPPEETGFRLLEEEAGGQTFSIEGCGFLAIENHRSQRSDGDELHNIWDRSSNDNARQRESPFTKEAGRGMSGPSLDPGGKSSNQGNSGSSGNSGGGGGSGGGGA